MKSKSVRIVGAGLIGTSIGLALKAAGASVQFVDVDANAELLANDLVKSGNFENPDLIIIATPPSSFKSAIEREETLNPQAILMDIGSVKTKPLLEVSTIEGLLSRFCGTHPMAGREVSGAVSARADLFLDRAWIITPTSETSAAAKAMVLEVIAACGAQVVEMSAEDHDERVALISHLPQTISSLLAAQLSNSNPEALALAGGGLRDTVRIAGSDPKLWGEILAANEAALLPLLISLQSDLSALISAASGPAKWESLVAAGRAGKSSIPGKHGGKSREYSYLPIVIDDRPGQLGSLFNACAKADVNIEDLALEHSPGQLTAVITLAIAPEDIGRLSEFLTKDGWNVHSVS
uniref:prephenate dehydrogenase n=2 Tax=Candidatus Planktophila sp. TaxID=2175601 RepID=UPI00404AE1BC